MNERIRELFQQSSIKAFDHTVIGSNPRDYVCIYNKVFDPEKFAELIVLECIRYFNEEYTRDFDTLWREDLTKGIKHHFGVKE